MKGADGKPSENSSNLLLMTTQHSVCVSYKMIMEKRSNSSRRTISAKVLQSVTEAILQKWLTSDAPTLTYHHLIECLRQSELSALSALAEQLITTVGQGMLYSQHSYSIIGRHSIVHPYVEMARKQNGSYN